MNGQKQRVYEFGEFRLEADERQLLHLGKTVTIPAKAFDLLVVLVENQGQLVEKDELYERVWGNQIVEESNLTVQMSAIRKALGERKNSPKYISTVAGFGYRFVGEVNGNHPNTTIIQTETIQKIVIEEEIFEDKPPQLKGKSFSSRNFAFYLIPFAFLLTLLVGVYVWKNIGRVNNQPFSVKRLTTNGGVNLAVLSPNGKFFAYSIKEKGSYRTEIRLGQADGSSDVTLIPMSDAVYNPMTFSADGSWLYYVQSKPRESSGELYKTPVLGGVSQKLASGINNYLSIAPGEKQIAFTRNNGEKKTSSVIIANLDGTNERELVVRPIDAVMHSLSLAWSADGSLLAFGAVNQKTESREIFVANTADGIVTQLTSLDWFEIAKLEWLKDKSGLLAVARDKKTTLSSQIWQIDYPSGVARAATGDVSKYGSALSVSANQVELVSVQVNFESNIWVAPAGNFKEAKQTTFGSIGRQDGWNGMDWTPDGRIVYTARIDQSLTIWIMNADGTNARQLTPNGFWDRRLSVSADGTFIVFDSNRSGNSEIWRVGTDGNDLQQLTFDSGNQSPSLTPDGKWLVYEHSDSEGTSIRRVDLEGGKPLILASKSVNNPHVSPDGKFVACGYSASGKPQLAVFSIEGGAPVKLFNAPPTHNFENMAIRWSPDGRFISYRDWANGIWQQSIEGGAPVRLENLPQEKFYTYGWSPDYKQFAFVRGQEIRDVVLINNFR